MRADPRIRNSIKLLKKFYSNGHLSPEWYLPRCYLGDNFCLRVFIYYEQVQGRINWMNTDIKDFNSSDFLEFVLRGHEDSKV